MIASGCDAHIQDTAKLFCRERKERLECNRKRSTDLERYIQDRCSPVHIGLRHLPRLCVCEILVAKTGNVHSFLESLTELVSVEISLHFLLERLDLCKCLCINRLRLKISRHLSIKIFMRKHHGTIHEIAEDGNEFAVVASLEILPGEIIVLCFRSIGSEHITKHILLARELLQILVKPYSPSA